ncbi:MAG: hypothetical protein EX254_04705, partial [Flavobacteriaceae bacterium]
MGVLLRGAAENFNPQIMTEENSLSVHMKKDFKVKRKTFDLFGRYARWQSFCVKTGRQNAGARAGKVMKAAEQIYDNAYRINYDGALVLPAYFDGGAIFGGLHDAGNPSPDMSGVTTVTYTGGKNSGNITTNTIGSVAVKHDPASNIFGDKFNPNDSFVLKDGLGTLCIITDVRRASDDSHFVLDVKTVGPATAFDEGSFADGEVVTEAGNYFGQGSMRGYQRYTRNKWRINYSSIHRYSFTMTGSAKRQKIAWIYNESDRGARMWEYEEILKGEKIFHMMNELSLRYSRISMDATSHAWFENWGTNQLTLSGFKLDTGITAPITGDGWIPQIVDNATFDYNPNTGVAHTLLDAVLMSLSNRSPAGSEGNVYLAITDKLGRKVINDGMHKLLGWGNATGDPANVNAVSHVAVSVGGAEVKLGFTISRYEYLGNELIVMEDELLNNPAFHTTSGGVTGAGHIFYLNITPINGISNCEIIAAAGRDFVKKTIDGLHSFDANADRGSKAASGFDGAR